ncbi:MAG: quinone-dependent dihydroorotate dehydrogenase [Bacteroidetes bacterium]|nr:MAG: quinone-dependent dihydroorotate dehydrogenase [Bacteroidota bacterium]
MYKYLIRPVLFRFDPEGIHHFSFRLLQFSSKLPLLPALLRKHYGKQQPSLSRELWGLHFANPVGLAAGFDKDALLGSKWRQFGFGFVEVGTVTPRPQAGNARKRLFRLPKDRALINRMGFNNAGVEAMVARLKKMDREGIILGANIGKNKDTPNERAVEDYEYCFNELFEYVDYFVVNVSSPNTPGLRTLQEKEPLTHLLNRLQQLNRQKPSPKPLLLKIAPDLTQQQLDDIVEVARATGLSGLIATNTTIARDGLRTPASEIQAIGPGGLSGQPLKARALEVIRYLHQQSQGEIPIIGVGGIMSAQDARERLQAGAALVQVYTGFVYEGPGFVKRILTYLSKMK